MTQPYNEGRDSRGNVGPTMQRIQDLYRFKKMRGDALENIFNVVAPLGMYSGDAQGIINPFKSFSPGLKEAIGRGASRKEMLDKHNAVWTGKKWEEFTPDQLTGNLSGSGPLSRYISNVPEGIKNVPVGFKDLGPENGGVFYPAHNMIEINSNRPVSAKQQSLLHEPQHANDLQTLGRSAGADPRQINPEHVQDLQSMLREMRSKNDLSYTNMDHYLHNQGEIRARLNDRLQTGMKNDYLDQGLQSVFNKRVGPVDYQYHPELIWGGD